MSPNKVEQNARELKTNEKKWGTDLMDAGWTVIPTILLEKQQQLGLDAVNLNLLLQIIKHWWHVDKAPFPGKRGLAAHLGVSARTVQRRLGALEKAGLIGRKKRSKAGGGNDTTAFFFDGLIERARPYAVEKNKERDEAKADDLKKAKKKGLKLVK